MGRWRYLATVWLLVACTEGPVELYHPCEVDRCEGDGSERCQAAPLTLPEGGTRTCSVQCTAATPCPQGGECLIFHVPSGFAPSGLCAQACTGSGCPEGLTCARVTDLAGGAHRVCVPAAVGDRGCGRAGQPCCAWGFCEEGVSCSGGTCTAALPAPYTACSPEGSLCTGGTRCMLPPLASPGSGERPQPFCTVPCRDTTAGCPDVGVPVRCTGSMCAVPCATNADCTRFGAAMQCRSWGGGPGFCVPWGPAG